MDNKKLEGAFIGRGVSDFAGGSLPFEVRVKDSDWNKPTYLPTEEKQYGKNGDKLNCVTQSNHNTFEFQLNQMIHEDTLPSKQSNWLKKNGYIDNNWKVNFSEKYNSILNKTALYKGNWLYIVADDARKNGLIPQSMLTEKVEESWGDYYKESQITDKMKKLGKEFLTLFDISYEWIDDVSIENLVKQLQHTPLQIVFPNHAVVEIKSKKKLMEYFDSYSPFVKEKKQNKITHYMKLVISPIIAEEVVELPENIKIIKDKDSNAVGIWYAASSAHKLMEHAKAINFPIPKNKDGSLDWGKFVQGELTLNKVGEEPVKEESSEENVVAAKKKIFDSDSNEKSKNTPSFL